MSRLELSWGHFGRGMAAAPTTGSPPPSNPYSTPRSQPSSALPFYVQIPPRTKPESTVDKASCKQGKILIVICQVLSIQSRGRIPHFTHADCLPGADPRRVGESSQVGQHGSRESYRSILRHW